MVSPQLGGRFDLEGVDLCLTGPDGRRFVHYEVVAQIAQLEQQAAQAVQRTEAARQRAEAAEAELVRLRALLKQQGLE